MAKPKTLTQRLVELERRVQQLEKTPDELVADDDELWMRTYSRRLSEFYASVPARTPWYIRGSEYDRRRNGR